jgi:L-lactate dehydrogenase
LEELASADAVVVTAGRGGAPDESRLALLRDNAAIVGQIASGFKNLRGLLIVVTNPVDLMTRVAAEASGLPPARVIGTGTMLDTARLRQVLGRELALEPRSIHAQVVGEHGDSEVVLWSSASVGGVPLRRWPAWTPSREESVASEVRRAAHEIIRRKGVTNHAIGLVTAALLRWSLRGERRVLTVSRVQEGAMGLRDVALSLPSIVGTAGAVEVLEPALEASEREALLRSAGVLSSVWETL